MATKRPSFDTHLPVIEQILGRFGLKSVQLTRLALPWYNNFIYKIELAEPAFPSSFAPQPGTVPPPSSGVSTLVLRFSNPDASGMNNANRVENIVASQHLVRQALHAADLPPIVPAVYAWAPYRLGVDGACGLGWILDEFRPGGDLRDILPSLSLDEKKSVVAQIADVFVCIQRLKLPAGMTKFGGLTFDERGEIVDGQMPILPHGPWETYAETWRVKLQTKLKDSEKEGTVLFGWRPNGVRDRIEQFLVNGGVEKMLRDVDLDKRVLVHGDFTTQNMLFDNESKRITALLDFDFATVTHPCHEFFRGLSDIGGGVPPKDQFLETSVRAGAFDRVPENLSDEERERWEIAKTWDVALASRDGIRPSEITGLGGLEDLTAMVNLICPHKLSHPMMLKTVPREAQEKQRGENEAKLLQLLDKYVL